MEELNEREEEQYFRDMDMMYEEQREEAMQVEAEYLAAKSEVDKYNKRLNELKEIIISLAAKGMEFEKLEVVHSKRKGNVNMKELQRKYDIMDSEIDKFRKPDIEYDSIRIKKV